MMMLFALYNLTSDDDLVRLHNISEKGYVHGFD